PSGTCGRCRDGRRRRSARRGPAGPPPEPPAARPSPSISGSSWLIPLPGFQVGLELLQFGEGVLDLEGEETQALVVGRGRRPIALGQGRLPEVETIEERHVVVLAAAGELVGIVQGPARLAQTAAVVVQPPDVVQALGGVVRVALLAGHVEAVLE